MAGLVGGARIENIAQVLLSSSLTELNAFIFSFLVLNTDTIS